MCNIILVLEIKNNLLSLSHIFVPITKEHKTMMVHVTLNTKTSFHFHLPILSFYIIGCFAP